MCANFTFENIDLRPSPLAASYGRTPGFYCKGPSVTGHVNNVSPFDSRCVHESDGGGGDDVRRALQLPPPPAPALQPPAASSKCGKPCACEITGPGALCSGGWAAGCLPLPCSACDEVGCNWCINGTCVPFWAHDCQPFPT